MALTVCGDRVLWLACVVLLACGDAAAEREVHIADAADVDVDDADDVSGPEVRDDSAAHDVAVDVQPEVTRGIARGDRAQDFEFALADGGTFHFAARSTGSESFVIVSDGITVSDLDPTSIWESERDLQNLLDRSPDDVHYLFVSVASAELAPANISAMQARIDGLIASLSEPFQSHWRARLHVAATRAQDLDAWPGPALLGHLALGFGIDHDQRIRGLGSLADVSRYDRALADSGAWPWQQNLAYAAYEAEYMHTQAALRARLTAEDAAIVPVFSGEILSQFADAEVALDDLAIATFDTLEVEITMRCPDPDKPEFGNCGAWDYLAWLSVQVPSDDGPVYREVARFITTYHREAHWVVDATPMLALIQDAASARLHWEFAPEWNVQPTATWMSLRFSNKNKQLRPVSTSLMFTGGDFGSAYNDRAPFIAPIPATTRKAEIWTLVTGHGAGPNQCAEFCAHSHVIEVNGTTHNKTFLEVGDDDACLGAIARGMTPNQGGTWWFGRGGWCPGAPVEPWVIDVTADVGALATITYEGRLGGRAPPDGSGNIVLTSYLVLYEFVGSPSPAVAE